MSTVPVRVRLPSNYGNSHVARFIIGRFDQQRILITSTLLRVDRKKTSQIFAVLRQYKLITHILSVTVYLLCSFSFVFSSERNKTARLFIPFFV
jgi:hypothetical protein